MRVAYEMKKEPQRRVSLRLFAFEAFGFSLLSMVRLQSK